jgi:hypothetical protein
VLFISIMSCQLRCVSSLPALALVIKLVTEISFFQYYCHTNGRLHCLEKRPIRKTSEQFYHYAEKGIFSVVSYTRSRNQSLINSFIPSFYETFSPDEMYTCCPLELQKAPLRGKDVGTVSFSFTPCARTTREFKWRGTPSRCLAWP